MANQNQELEKKVREIGDKKREIFNKIIALDNDYKFSRMSHYRHVTGNLMQDILRVADLGKTDEEHIKGALKEIKLYETYFYLLRNYSAFRVGESRRDGAFPGIRDTGECDSSGVENYILEAEKRLKE